MTNDTRMMSWSETMDLNRERDLMDNKFNKEIFNTGKIQFKKDKKTNETRMVERLKPAKLKLATREINKRVVERESQPKYGDVGREILYSQAKDQLGLAQFTDRELVIKRAAKALKDKLHHKQREVLNHYLLTKEISEVSKLAIAQKFNLNPNEFDQLIEKGIIC